MDPAHPVGAHPDRLPVRQGLAYRRSSTAPISWAPEYQARRSQDFRPPARTQSCCRSVAAAHAGWCQSSTDLRSAMLNERYRRRERQRHRYGRSNRASAFQARPSRPSGLGGTYTATSNTNGAYSMSGMVSGTYSFTATRSGYTAKSARNGNVPSGGTLAKDISLWPIHCGTTGGDRGSWDRDFGAGGCPTATNGGAGNVSCSAFDDTNGPIS